MSLKTKANPYYPWTKGLGQQNNSRWNLSLGKTRPNHRDPTCIAVSATARYAPIVTAHRKEVSLSHS